MYSKCTEIQELVKSLFCLNLFKILPKEQIIWFGATSRNYILYLLSQHEAMLFNSNDDFIHLCFGEFWNIVSRNSGWKHQDVHKFKNAHKKGTISLSDKKICS